MRSSANGTTTEGVRTGHCSASASVCRLAWSATSEMVASEAPSREPGSGATPSTAIALTSTPTPTPPPTLPPPPPTTLPPPPPPLTPPPPTTPTLPLKLLPKLLPRLLPALPPMVCRRRRATCSSSSRAGSVHTCGSAAVMPERSAPASTAERNVCSAPIAAACSRRRLRLVSRASSWERASARKSAAAEGAAVGAPSGWVSAAGSGSVAAMAPGRVTGWGLLQPRHRPTRSFEVNELLGDCLGDGSASVDAAA